MVLQHDKCAACDQAPLAQRGIRVCRLQDLARDGDYECETLSPEMLRVFVELVEHAGGAVAVQCDGWLEQACTLAAACMARADIFPSPEVAAAWVGMACRTAASVDMGALRQLWARRWIVQSRSAPEVCSPGQGPGPRPDMDRLPRTMSNWPRVRTNVRKKASAAAATGGAGMTRAASSAMPGPGSRDAAAPSPSPISSPSPSSTPSPSLVSSLPFTPSEPAGRPASEPSALKQSRSAGMLSAISGEGVSEQRYGPNLRTLQPNSSPPPAPIGLKAGTAAAGGSGSTRSIDIAMEASPRSTGRAAEPAAGVGTEARAGRAADRGAPAAGSAATGRGGSTITTGGGSAASAARPSVRIKEGTFALHFGLPFVALLCLPPLPPLVLLLLLMACLAALARAAVPLDLVAAALRPVPFALEFTGLLALLLALPPLPPLALLAILLLLVAALGALLAPHCRLK